MEKFLFSRTLLIRLHYFPTFLWGDLINQFVISTYCTASPVRGYDLLSSRFLGFYLLIYSAEHANCLYINLDVNGVILLVQVVLVGVNKDDTVIVSCSCYIS